MKLGEKILSLRKNYSAPGVFAGQLSQQELGLAIGVHRHVIRSWEKGLYRPEPANLEALAKFFKKPVGFFTDDPEKAPILVMEEAPRYGISAPLQVIEVPIVGRAAASGIDYAPDEPPRGFTPFLLHGPQRGRLEAVQVAGDSMEPTIHNGDFIILKDRSFFKSGQLAIVRVDGQTLLKRVKVHGESIELLCDNKRHKSMPYAAKAVEILAAVHKIVSVRDPE